MIIDLEKIDIQPSGHFGCHCGSEKELIRAFDTKGIYLTSGCEDCIKQKLEGYQHDVLYGNDYECEERVEPLD